MMAMALGIESDSAGDTGRGDREVVKRMKGSRMFGFKGQLGLAGVVGMGRRWWRWRQGVI